MDNSSFSGLSGESFRPACKKCGYPGHFTYQCRNLIVLNPAQNPMLDISSTSSECSDDETPLKLLNKQELDTKASEKRDEKSKKKHKHKKKSKKRDRKKSSNSESESDAADSRKDRHKKRKKKKKKNESANEKHKKHANSSKKSHHKIRRSETTSRSSR